MVKDVTIDHSLKALLDNGVKTVDKTEKSSINFTDVLKDTISEVNGLQKEAATATSDLLKGDSSIHETMIAIEKADLSFRFMMKTRNKIMEAYKEVMRMQV